jgi:hypothetical protein
MRVSFRAIAESLPDLETIPSETAVDQLDPLPAYAKGEGGNTEIISYGELLAYSEPPLEEGYSGRDLQLGADLCQGFKWTGPDNPLSESARNGRDPEFARKLEAALETRYLIVYRFTGGRSPTVEPDGATFTPGFGNYVAYVVDLPARELRGTFRFSAASSPNVQYSYGQSDNRGQRAVAFLDSDLWTNLRSSLRGELTRATGGSFDW